MTKQKEIESLSPELRTANVFYSFFKSIPPLILILLVFFLVRGLIFASVIPPWQAPDEPLHYDYIHYLSIEKKWPVLGKVAICRQVKNSLRGYYFSPIISEKMPYRLKKDLDIPENYSGPTKHDTRTSKYGMILKFNGKGRAPNQIIQHPPLYYIIGAFFYLLFLKFLSFTAQIWFLRIFSVILGFATVYIGWLSAKLLFEKQPFLQYALVGFLALQPMFGYIFSVINNDSLTIFLFSFLFYLMVLTVKEGMTQKRLYLIAIIFSLGMLTKVTFIISLPAIIFVLVFAQKKSQWPVYLIASVISFVIFGWWYIRLLMVYGTFLPRIDFYQPNPANGLANVSLLGYLIFTPFKNKIFSSFWGSFGWLRLRYPYRINFILKYMTFLVMTGLGLEIVIGFFRKIKWNYEMKLMILSVGLVVLLLVSILIPSWSGARKTGFIEGVQGRYLFPLMIPLAYLLVLGVNRLVSYKKGYYTFLIVTFSVLMLDFLAIFRFILPYFYG